MSSNGINGKQASKRIRYSDVAELAGVSRPAVSYVLGGNAQARKRVSEATAAKIRQIAGQLGFQPNSVARALATGRTQLITLWTYAPFKPFSAMVAAEAQRCAWARGFGMLAADVSLGEEKGVHPVVSPWPCDGILAMDCGTQPEIVLAARPSPQTPIVSMGTSQVPETDFVRLDLTGAFGEATRHLLAQGCRRIAYCTHHARRSSHPTPAAVFGTPRNAYQAAMREAGLVEEIISLDDTGYDHARQRTTHHIAQHGCPDGILCRDDDEAIGVCRALCELGFEVGRDVLVIGCNGLDVTRYLPCPLSTIVLPVAEMCRQGMELLEARMSNPAAPLQSVTLEARLEIRESSSRPLRRKAVPRPKGRAGSGLGIRD